jgi:hypothetical protein
VLDQVSSAPFQEALNWLNRLLMSDLQTSREPVIKELLPLTGDEDRDALRIRHLGVGYLLNVSRSPPSPGYEPLLGMSR